MNPTSFASAPLLLGFVLGLRHAFDADHVVAVATIVSRERSPFRSCFIGGFWGLGHSASLLLVGIGVVGMGLKLPSGLGVALELLVALMLVFLGMRGMARGRGPITHHEHPRSVRSLGRRPFWVGVVHGLAGSGTLALLVLATIPSQLHGLAYIGCFGAGSMAGMMAMSTALSIPISMSGAVGTAAGRGVARGVSLVSVSYGLFYAVATISAAAATRHAP